jgi:RHS repeat-associated protein
MRTGDVKSAQRGGSLALPGPAGDPHESFTQNLGLHHACPFLELAKAPSGRDLPETDRVPEPTPTLQLRDSVNLRSPLPSMKLTALPAFVGSLLLAAVGAAPTTNAVPLPTQGGNGGGQQVGGGTLTTSANLVQQMPPQNPPGVTPSYDSMYINGVASGCCDEGEGDGRGALTNDNGTSHKVLLHSGQEVLTEVDLVVPGRDPGSALVFQRRHTTRRDNPDSVLGPAWAFSLHQSVAPHPAAGTPEIPTGSLLLEGFGRSDVLLYKGLAADGVSHCYEGDSGRFLTGLYKLGDPNATPAIPPSLELWLKGGAVQMFAGVVEHYSGGVFQGVEGGMTGTRSPAGNEIQFTLNGSGHITQIVDSFGRIFELEYDLTPRLTKIKELTGTLGGATPSIRLAVDFEYYGGSGNLSTVKLPNVTPGAVSTGTPFSGRPTKTYAYVAPGQFPQPTQTWLQNALVSATYPNQNVGTTPGAARLEWTYWVGNPLCEGFVATHKVGTASFNYDYSEGVELLASTGSVFAGGVNDKAIRTVVTDKNGTETIFQMNRYGQVLSEQILSPTPKARPNDPAAWARQYQYNDDQLISRETLPGGLRRNVQYPPPTVGRRSQGNAQVVKITPEPGAPDPSNLGVLVTKKLYEPIFNHILAVVDPRGLNAGTSNNASLSPLELRYATRFSYDYMEDYGLAFDAFRERLNLPDTAAGELAFTQLLTDSGVNVNAPVANPASSYQPCGQVTRIDRPDVKPLVLSNPALAEGTVVQTAFETFEYNGFGQRVAHTDPEGLVTEWEYFGAGDPAGQGAFGDSGQSGATSGGFIKELVVDVGGVNATTKFTYTSGGGNHGIPFAVEAPNGTVTFVASNLADQVTQSITLVGGNPTGFVRAFDANGNLHIEEVFDYDPVDPDPLQVGWVTNVYSYSILDQLVLEQLNYAAVGGAPCIENEYSYNADELLGSATLAKGTPEQTTRSWLYDARNLPVSASAGAGGVQTETRFLVDALGNVTAVIDSDDHPDSPQHPVVGSTAGWEGDFIENFYDGWGRLIESRDRVGTRTEYSLDRAGLLESTRVYGTVEDFFANETLLSHTKCFYDERAQPIVCGAELFYYSDGSGTSYSHSPEDPGVLTYGGLAGHWVLQGSAYNKRGQPVELVDAEGDVTVVAYDSAARVELVTDALASTTQYVYDVSGNALTATTIERSTLGSIADPFVSTATYDGLNRLKTATAPNGEVSEYFYDARGRVTRVRDALANDTEYRYDAFGRQTHELRFLSSIPTTGLSGAVGASISNVDVAQGGGDGVVTLVREYDSLHRLIKQTDDGALDTASTSPSSTPRTTEYVYDALSRMTAINYANGESESWTYNADGELETHVSQQGVTCHFDVDPRGRTRFMRFEGPYSDPAVDSTVGIPGLFGPGPGGTNFNRRFAWDGLDRLWGQCDHNGGTVWDDVYVDHWLDSLGRKITEKQRIDTAPYNGANHVEIAQMHYQGASRMTSLRYPKNATESARTLTYTHDALDRVATISDATGAIASYDYVGAGRLARLEYFYDSNGKGAVLDLRNAAGDSTKESSSGALDAGYDANGRPVNWRWMANNGSSPSLITGYQSSYNGPGGVGTGRRDGEVREHFGLEDTYRHDSQYRMTEFVRDYASVAAPGVTTAASLDGVDKFTSLVEGTTDFMPEVDSASSELNQYSSFAGGARVYDKLGNLLEDGSGKYFQYGPDGRLVTVWTARPSNGGTKIVSYVYDAIGRRIVEQDNVTGIAKQLVYAGGWQVVEEKNLRHTGDPYRQFVTGPRMDEHLQMRVFDGQGGHEDYWYHCNSQGFVGAITNDSEDVEEYYTYSMLGQPTVFTPNIGGSGVTAQGAVSTVGNPYSFQGRRYDDETGWFHFRHRQYDPLSGEFTTVDPSGMWRHGQGAGYSALDCDMWGRTDPLGLDTILGDFLWSITPPIVDDLVKGVVDTAYGVGETAVGVIAAPFDGGELISSGIDEIVDGLGATVGGVGDAASLAWQSPQAVAGVGWIAIGVVSWCLGAGEAPDIAAKAWEGGMGFEYANHPLMGGGAMSLGPFTFYESGSKAWAGPEEHAHQLQSLWMGPLYLPGHLVGGGVSLCLSTFWPDGGLRGGQSDWHRYNPLEYGPGLSPPVPFF